MKAESKAKELISRFNNSYDEESKSYILYQNVEESKRCALIAVDEIMQHAENSYYNKDIINGAKLYWQEVKQEIEKLWIQ
jgi:hypothetical protein